MSAVLAAETSPPPDRTTTGRRAAAGADQSAEVGAAWEALDHALEVIGAQVLGGAVSDEALLASIERLARMERRVAAERLRRTGELDARDAAVRLGARTAADLLASALGQTRGEARADTETAAALQALPQTAERMRAGDIGVGQAQTAARTLARMGAAADDATRAAFDELVAETAPSQNRRQLRDTAERFAHQHAAEELAERERRAFAARSLRRWNDQTTGLRHFDLALPAAQAAVMDTAIDAALARARHHRDRDTDEDPRAFEQRGADAMVELASHSLACPDVEHVAGGQTQVLLVVTPDEPADLDGYGPVSTATAQLLACDAETRTVVRERNGEILDLGRTRRDPTPAQRAAVIARDRGCVGCGAPVSRCQVHHIRWWGRDCGPTDEPNLCLLCWDCHVHVHHHGWRVVGDHINGFRVERPWQRHTS